GPSATAPAAAWVPADREDVRLSPPQPVAAPQPHVAQRVDVAAAPGPEPARPTSAEAPPTPALPAGIAQFTYVRPRVAAALKPDLDGLDWLQGNGFLAVVNIRAPGEDDSADRRQVEKRGMKFVSLEVSAETFSPPLVDEFRRWVGTASLQPVFVYD